MKDWNNNFYLKWGLTLLLMLIAGFFVLKTRGHANELSHKYYYLRSNWSGKAQEVRQAVDRSQKQK